MSAPWSTIGLVEGVAVFAEFGGGRAGRGIRRRIRSVGGSGGRRSGDFGRLSRRKRGLSRRCLRRNTC